MHIRTDIFQHEREHRKVTAAQKAELKKRILELPDNLKIKRVNDRCFIGTFGSLNGNWSVEHHNFKTQYRLLAGIVDKAETAFSALRQLRLAKIKGSITVGGSCDGRYIVRLHPDVIAGLRKVL